MLSRGQTPQEDDYTEVKQKKRRPRSDEDGRNFSCSCGKSYLSYPALYTHIKTKHNGKPEFSKLCSRSELSEDLKEEEVEESEKAEDSKNMENLKKYLNKLFPFTSKDKDSEKRLKESSKDDQQYLKSIKEYWEKHKKEEEVQLNDTYATLIDNVLGKFLVDIEPELSKNAIRFVQNFVVSLRNGINSLEKNDKFCKTNCAANLPVMMNSLFGSVFQQLESDHLYSRHPTIPCKTIFHFCRWLFVERFTNHSLKFNAL